MRFSSPSCFKGSPPGTCNVIEELPFLVTPICSTGHHLDLIRVVALFRDDDSSPCLGHCESKAPPTLIFTHSPKFRTKIGQNKYALKDSASKYQMRACSVCWFPALARLVLMGEGSFAPSNSVGARKYTHTWTHRVTGERDSPQIIRVGTTPPPCRLPPGAAGNQPALKTSKPNRLRIDWTLVFFFQQRL